MRNLFTIILSTLAITAVVFLAIVLSGLFVWLLWPLVVPAVFPGAVASGMVAKELGLITSIGLSILTSVLFGSTRTSKSEK